MPTHNLEEFRQMVTAGIEDMAEAGQLRQAIAALAEIIHKEMNGPRKESLPYAESLELIMSGVHSAIKTDSDIPFALKRIRIGLERFSDSAKS